MFNFSLKRWFFLLACAIFKPEGLYTIATYRVTMATTIQVSGKLVEELKTRKLYGKESYEEVIWDLIEDNMELSEETKRHIAQAEKEIKEGKTVSLAEVEKKLGLWNVWYWVLKNCRKTIL